ncbi:hypothetical protein M2373_003384 [Chryseobacterium sp. JUb7]|nr:hypothetical protein [Chryseobacterium sp. JUb7]
MFKIDDEMLRQAQHDNATNESLIKNVSIRDVMLSEVEASLIY